MATPASFPPPFISGGEHIAEGSTYFLAGALLRRKMSAEGAGGGKSPQEAFTSGPGEGARQRPVVPLSPQELEAAARKLRTRNTITALLIGSFTLGVYLYSFHAISQETFLDDLEVEAQDLRAKAAQTSGTDRVPDGNAQG